MATCYLLAVCYFSCVLCSAVSATGGNGGWRVGLRPHQEIKDRSEPQTSRGLLEKEEDSQPGHGDGQTQDDRRQDGPQKGQGGWNNIFGLAGDPFDLHKILHSLDTLSELQGDKLDVEHHRGGGVPAPGAETYWRELWQFPVFLRHAQRPYARVKALVPSYADAVMTGALSWVEPEDLVQNLATECRNNSTGRHRTADGSCNNRHNLGTANTPYKRLLPPQYDDGVGAPRSKGKDGRPLPSPSEVSRLVHRPREAKQGRTLLLMQWGQLVAYDLSLTPQPAGSESFLRCCGENRSLPLQVSNEDCFPILLAPEDTRFQGRCMDFVRSLPSRDAAGRKTVPREQVNAQTSFLDGSAIYGSNKDQTRFLRVANPRLSAYLRTSQDDLLPASSVSACIYRQHSHHHCFLAGDLRVNLVPSLTALHTIWMRLHNRIVDELKKVRPRTEAFPEERLISEQNKLFHMSRKIIIGILQNIHYGEWLPLVLDAQTLATYDLQTGHRVPYRGEVDPRISNAFAAAAFRFGHSLIPDHINISGTTCQLRQLINHVDLVFEDMVGVVRSMTRSRAQDQAQGADLYLGEEVTSHLFEPPDQTEKEASRGADLAAYNIQRGRDHGLPPFNPYRRLCGLPPFQSFAEFGEVGKVLQDLYEHVDDVDLFPGGLAEAASHPGYVGPTFGCIIGRQFHDLKFGDRHYFETQSLQEGFTDEQLDSIRKVTMAHVLCFFPTDKDLANPAKGFYRDIQANAFLAASDRNHLIPCSKLRRDFLNFNLWSAK